MESSFFHRLSRILWRALVALVVLLAVYVSVGRLVTVNLTPWRTTILQEVNARVPFIVEAEQVGGLWQSFTPEIILTGLRLRLPGSAAAPLELSEGRIGLDVLNSLRTASLQMTRLELTNLSLRAELSRTGKLQLAGFGDGAGVAGAQLQEFLLNIERITLKDNLLKLRLPNGEVRDLDLNLVLIREGSRRHVEADLTSTTGTHIAIISDGVGNPFDPDLFSGEVYLDVQSPDLGAVQEVLADRQLPAWVEGALDLKLWLDWERGQASVAMQLEALDLLVSGADSDWSVPLDRVAMEIRLLEHEDRWTVFVADMQVANDGVNFTLPRLQVDAWDKALRLRATEVPIGPISALLADTDALPQGMREVIATLQPAGQLPALQLRIADTQKPAEDWELRAKFEDLAVEPYKGAPGLRSASGYIRLATHGGIVVLDSRAMTLEFPAIYHQSLNFEEVRGTLRLDWNADTVRLGSGVLTTRGEEGIAKVLFGLSIPLQPNDVGIEMDLLVGLQNAHPVHRVKYIPYVLKPNLLSWLADSIGDGRIEQGAFLWRGSLHEDAGALRTVQLAFNVADTQLSYHPEWPPVVVDEGIVLIDDSAVSVWSDQARLFDSSVENLSVETRLSDRGELMLGVAANVTGSAADGLKVLNESPLAGIVGPTFAAWSLDGSLETDLQIELNLSDHEVPPQVEVSTRWRDVNMNISPGNLPIQAVNGEFNYSTTDGFSADSLVGELWGKTVTAKLQQHYGAGSEAYDPAHTVLDILLAAQADMADVRDWLALPPLAFANGNTSADIGLRLVPGEPPLLTVDSDLRGVSLDLPQPWQKRAEEPQHLHLQMPLATGGIALLLEIDEQLKLRLDIRDGILRGGALGLNQDPGPPLEGRLTVRGHAPLIQGDEWMTFAKTYLGEASFGFGARAGVKPELLQNTATDISAHVESEVVEEMSSASPLDIVIENVRAQSLLLLEQELRDVTFSLRMDGSGTSGSVQTDWLNGELSVAGDGGLSRIDIQHLDLSRLPEFHFEDEDEDEDKDKDKDKGQGEIEERAPIQDFPPVDVVLRNLFQGDQRLGELSFQLQGQGSEVIARNITGELGHLRLAEELPGRLVWHRGREGFSELEATLGFEDLGDTLEYFGYQKIVETTEGKFHLDLQWPGAPSNFSMLDLEGSMQVTIGPGSFPQAPSGAAGALRVVSILNLADIVQRLSLTDAFESGISFYSVEGEMYLHSGVLEVPRMDVEGGSSFRFSGVSDLQAQSLSGELVATLPVARNLPWIAALAASLPVAAGVYVVSKIFDKQMNRLSSAVYSIAGSWDEPEVRFDHIFDDTQAPIQSESP